MGYAVGLFLGPVIGGSFAQNEHATWRWVGLLGVSRSTSEALSVRMSDDELTVIPGILHRHSILGHYHGTDFFRLPECTITPSRGNR